LVSGPDTKHTRADHRDVVMLAHLHTRIVL
jgi:hypothetical protein